MIQPIFFKSLLTALSIILVLNFFIPFPAFAAWDTITFDAALASGSGTASFTVGANSNRAMVLCEFTVDGDTASTPDFNGTSFTAVDKTNFDATHYVYSFILIAPTTGTHTITTHGGSNWSVQSLYNVKQTGQPDAHGITSGTSNAPSGTLATVSDSDMVVGCAFVSSQTATVSGWTNMANHVGQSSPSSAQDDIGNSAIQTTHGNVTQSESLSGSSAWNVLQVALAPTGTAPAGAFNFWQFLPF